MIRFLFTALLAFLAPGFAYYLWKVFAPERFGGSPAFAKGEWRPMPWRVLAWTGAAAVVVVFVVTVSMEGQRAPQSELLQSVPSGPSAR